MLITRYTDLPQLKEYRWHEHRNWYKSYSSNIPELPSADIFFEWDTFLNVVHGEVYSTIFHD